MKVRLTYHREKVVIEIMGASGAASAGFVIAPGQIWRKWSYKDLRQLGEGEHDLLSSVIDQFTLRG